MFLKEKATGDLVLIENLDELFAPLAPAVSGRDQTGEEEQDSSRFEKGQLVFPSGESLPRCWLDAHYPRA